MRSLQLPSRRALSYFFPSFFLPVGLLSAFGFFLYPFFRLCLPWWPSFLCEIDRLSVKSAPNHTDSVTAYYSWAQWQQLSLPWSRDNRITYDEVSSSIRPLKKQGFGELGGYPLWWKNSSDLLILLPSPYLNRSYNKFFLSSIFLSSCKPSPYLPRLD